MKWFLIATGVVAGYLLHLGMSWSEKDKLHSEILQCQKEVESLRTNQNSLEIDQDSKKLKIRSLGSKVDELQYEFQRISREKIALYVGLKDTQRKLALADEILGDLFLVLVRYLAVEAPQDQLNYMRRVARTPQLAEKRDTDKSEDINFEPRSHKSPKKAQRQQTSRYVVHEAELETLELADSKTFLNKTKIANVLDEMKSSKTISKMSGAIQQLQGAFAGKVVFSDQSKEPWDMEIEFTGDIQKAVLNGNMLVRLSKNGQAFSTGRGNGQLKDIKQLSDSKGLLLVTGENNVFQLYYLPSQDMFIGNHYRKTGPGEYDHRGTVELNRI